MTTPVARIVAATVLAGSVGVVAAQTTPHQGVQRSTVGMGLGRTELPVGSVFESRVDAAMQYVANIELVDLGQPQIDMAGLEVAPGFYASHSTSSVTGAIDYSLISRSWEDSDYNDVTHRLAANGEWNALPEWFGIRAQASYEDMVIDPVRSVNYGSLGIFGPGNLVEAAAASIGPALRHRFGDLEFVAEYDYGRVWYLNEGKGQPTIGFVTDQDSEDQSARVSLGTFDQGSRLLGKVFYDWQRSDFETALPYQYERAGVDIGYQFARTLSLVGDGGRESDLDVSSTEGGLDADFWSAGLRWEPSERTFAEARAGERYFGDSYSFSVSHRARLVEFNAEYSEQPMIETRLLSLGDFEPGELPPGLPEGGVGRFNSTPFVSRAANVGVVAAGSRTTVWVTGFHYDREYVRSLLGDEISKGAEVRATRQLASNLSADLGVSYIDRESTVSSQDPAALANSTNYDTNITLRLNRTSGSRLTLSAEALFLNRSGDQDIEGWLVALRARWMP